ncbi:hypothetical protein [Shimia aestuarii]|uniref:Uncharacterized protein n=1 Tax=Shimia aestuarii TaxID=254406 RepID=A0A1I4TWK8_9RHOB|nr:hypothetical protein [Shimia aestuarii]SFM81158.1 hypothetical protein SAMN04488042_1247 [Shimia aestuarii]
MPKTNPILLRLTEALTTQKMPKTNPILLRLTEAFEASAKEFSTENGRLSRLSEVMATQALEPRHALLDHIWVDFKADSGVVASVEPVPSEGCRIQLMDRGTSPWFSFSYILSVEALRSSRFLGLLIRGRAEGVAAFRPCLRYLLPDGFKDSFARNVILLEPDAEDQISFIRTDPQLVNEAVGAEVLFFFEGVNFDVTLSNVENLNI